jgi:transmembrane sensor
LLLTIYLKLKTELIERFFKKQCTPDEARKVAAYLKADPAVLEEYVSMHEWNAVESNFMPEEFWSEVWLNIQKKNKSKIISVKLKRVAVAACLILMIGTAYYYYSMPVKQISKPLASVTVLPKTQLQIAANNTKEIKIVVLEDSSVVQLSPNSSIQYDNPFPNNKREILLNGEARFIVAKNKKKPFTVYTGMLATTALGTIFSVKTSGNKNNITVKLFRGKVVIHAEKKDLKGWDKSVYLLPGEQMKFNIQKMLVSVEKIKNVNTNNLAKVKMPGAESSTSTLSFSNTLLPQVMQKLSAYYNIKIQYDSTLIDTMNFTGTVTKKDSLPVILKAITQMNNLNLTQQDKNFKISKLQQQ